jgi:undecaprenyl-diphosphatase
MSPLRKLGGAIAARARFWAGGENRAAAILLLVGFALTASAVLISRHIAREVMAHETQQFDDDVLRRIDAAKQQLGEHRKVVDTIFRDFTALGGFTTLTLLTVFVTGYLFLARRRGEAALTVAVAAGALAIDSALKSHYDRPRPEVFAHTDTVYTSSFPSGHSMMSMAIYLTLGVLLARLAPTWSARLFATGSTVVVALLVASSRMYAGEHFPTDVMAGALLGLAWALTVLCAAEVYRRAPSGETPGA